jgi:glyoxylase-like metal-dependent hydrolase (beta-lactamase superfamily II)
LHLIGGHTSGIQALQVATRRGTVILAGDTTQVWANIRDRNPFPLIADADRVLDGYLTLERLAEGPDHIIPGHEPFLLKGFQSYKNDPDIVRLDLDPI